MSFRFAAVFVFALVRQHNVTAQEHGTDSAKVLQEVIVQAYATDRPALEVGAALAFIGERDLNRFGNSSLLPAVNMVPGVRMEERSPGSYRFSLRGSLLRSPFGVRNVKMYWNGLPLTDGGGNTYINLIDFNAISDLEIIKGPGASLYGAGTGGVVLLNSRRSGEPMAEISTRGGSYGLWGASGSFQIAPGLSTEIYHQQSDGYRAHTNMKRTTVNLQYHVDLNASNTLDVVSFLSNLFYETPGALTRIQYEQDPTRARDNADALKASIANNSIYAGVSHQHKWSNQWSTRTGIYGSSSVFVNPTFLNYEERDERNLGGRMVNQYGFDTGRSKGKITFGAEYQHFSSPIRNYSNDQGSKGTLNIRDKLIANQSVVFVQGEFDLPGNVIVTAGASATFLKYDLIRYEPDYAEQVRSFDPVLSPRISLLKKLGRFHSVYGTVGYGFSPPSLSEVRPSTNEFNNGLAPEHGTNYEIGFKGKRSSFQYELALFQFDLKETIVIQRTASNADYYVNSGGTRQRGSEASLSWSPELNPNGLFSSFRVAGSYTLNYFHFGNYTNDAQDYSGNRLTGVAPNVVMLGIDTRVRSSFYINATASYTDHIPLNDSNTEYAAEYFLLGCKVGYARRLGDRTGLDVFLGGDNLLNESYSLGNDLNARAGRFFNAAPGNNFYIGAKLTLRKK